MDHSWLKVTHYVTVKAWCCMSNKAQRVAHTARGEAKCCMVPRPSVLLHIAITSLLHFSLVKHKTMLQDKGSTAISFDHCYCLVSATTSTAIISVSSPPLYCYHLHIATISLLPPSLHLSIATISLLPPSLYILPPSLYCHHLSIATISLFPPHYCRYHLSKSVIRERQG